MSAWFRRHWLTLLGVVPLIPAIAKGVLALVNIGGDIDFLVSRSQNPGWIGKMIGWVINPPGGAILPLIFVGLGCIYWDSRRASRKPTFAGKLAPTPVVIEWKKPLAAIDAFAEKALIKNKSKAKNKFMKQPS